MLAFLNALSPWHLLFVGIVAILLFGNRLPEVARSLGRSVNEFKRGLKEVKDNFDDAANDAPPPEKLQPPPDKVESGKIEQETEVKEPTQSGQSPSQ
jgi:sec-independent protein translocase protein TatA